MVYCLPYFGKYPYVEKLMFSKQSGSFQVTTTCVPQAPPWANTTKRSRLQYHHVPSCTYHSSWNAVTWDLKLSVSVRMNLQLFWVMAIVKAIRVILLADEFQVFNPGQTMMPQKISDLVEISEGFFDPELLSHLIAICVVRCQWTLMQRKEWTKMWTLRWRPRPSCHRHDTRGWSATVATSAVLRRHSGWQ